MTPDQELIAALRWAAGSPSGHLEVDGRQTTTRRVGGGADGDFLLAPRAAPF
jgi:hypothetical protein